MTGPFRHYTTFTTGWTPPTGDDASYVGDHPWANIGDLKSKWISDTAKHLSDEAVRGQTPSQVGDLLFAFKLSVGAVARVGYPMFTNEAIATFRPSAQLDLDYAYYAIPVFVPKNANTNIYGAPLLNASLIRSAAIALPPPDEQRAIADYLDRETARIDTLIEAQQRLIELLRERRGAVADQLLNPPGRMQTLKRVVAEVTVGIVVNPSAWYAESGVVALRGLNIRPGQVTADNIVYLTPEGDRLHAKSRLRAGDVIMVRTGQAGAAAVVPPELHGANAIDLLIVRPGPKSDPDFLTAYFNAPSTREKITHGSVGAIQGHFNVSALGELELPAIGLDEQRDRARTWAAKAAKIDALIAETEKFIELARERRSALITEAVTGQIDVRKVA